MTLTLVRVVRTEENRRSYYDQRHRVTKTIAEYRGSDGEIYRKAFEAKGKNPTVPQQGDPDEINKLRKQW